MQWLKFDPRYLLLFKPRLLPSAYPAQCSMLLWVSVSSCDGGVCNNDFLMQLVSTLIQRPVDRPAYMDMTSQGAAFLAGLAVGECWGQNLKILKFVNVLKFSTWLSFPKHLITLAQYDITMEELFCLWWRRVIDLRFFCKTSPWEADSTAPYSLPLRRYEYILSVLSCIKISQKWTIDKLCMAVAHKSCSKLHRFTRVYTSKLTVLFLLPGVWKNKKELREVRKTSHVFKPAELGQYQEVFQEWRNAMKRSMKWHSVVPA